MNNELLIVVSFTANFLFLFVQDFSQGKTLMTTNRIEFFFRVDHVCRLINYFVTILGANAFKDTQSRVQPQRLIDDHVKVGKVLDRLVIEVVLVRGLVGSVNLLLKTALDFRIHGKFVTLFIKILINFNCFFR